MKSKRLADRWWLMLDNEELNDTPLTLTHIFRIHKATPGKEIVVVHEKEVEKDDPEYFTLDLIKPTAKAKSPTKSPAKKIAKRASKRPARPLAAKKPAEPEKNLEPEKAGPSAPPMPDMPPMPGDSPLSSEPETAKAPPTMPPAPGDTPPEPGPPAMPTSPGNSPDPTKAGGPPSMPPSPGAPPPQPQSPTGNPPSAPPTAPATPPGPAKAKTPNLFSAPLPSKAPPPQTPQPVHTTATITTAPSAATPAQTSVKLPIPAVAPPPAIPEVTKPTGTGGLSAQLEQAKHQLNNCESAKEQAIRHTRATQDAADAAEQNLKQQEELLNAAKAEKDLRDNEHNIAKGTLSKAGDALEQATQLRENLQKQVEETAAQLNATEEALAKAQDEHAKWKTQVTNREQQLSALKATSEQTRAILTTLQDDETLSLAAQQSQAAVQAMEAALNAARDHESTSNRNVQQLTIQVADLRKALNG